MKSEAVYLLSCLLKNQGVDIEFSHQSREFSKQYGVTLSTVTALFSTLKKTQSLIVKEQYSLRGRGQYAYTLTKNTLLNHDEFGLLDKITQTENPAVTRLLKNDVSELIEVESSEDTQIKRRQSFRAANRLFLVVLLLHANELGVIEEVSSTRIRKMMGGISAARFKSQLNTLKAMGLIKAHVSGLTGKALFGRTKGSYYLNIEHPFLKSSFEGVSSLLLDFNRILYPYNESTEVKCLFDAYAHTWCIREQRTDLRKLEHYRWPEVMGGVMEDFPTQCVIHFFRNRALQDQMHQWVCQVASAFILKPASNLTDLTVNQCSDRLAKLLSFSKVVPMTRRRTVLSIFSTYQQVRLKFNSTYYLADVFSMDEPKDASQSYWHYVLLTRLIMKLGLNMASHYQKLLALGGIKGMNARQCAIIPLKREGDFCFQYELRFTQPEEPQRTIQVTVNAKEEVSLMISGERQEAQLPIQEIHRAFRSNPARS
ncbi:MAG: hypothetical protein CL785_04645 [Chloroflexi bacterium]|nr:hypothetical protein [Chloroflexota bacterium]|tara:strand:+ start:5220 stop:6668 length:1449 start_codon:yes stop_codon:yes gene_type:complete